MKILKIHTNTFLKNKNIFTPPQKKFSYALSKDRLYQYQDSRHKSGILLVLYSIKSLDFFKLQIITCS